MQPEALRRGGVGTAAGRAGDAASADRRQARGDRRAPRCHPRKNFEALLYVGSSLDYREGLLWSPLH